MIVKSLGLESFANFLSVSVSENLVSEKSYQFQKIWSRKKSISFGKFGLGKKISVSENYRKKMIGFRKFGLGKKVLVFGFGQNFGPVIQC